MNIYTLKGSEDGLYDVETSASRAARKAVRYGGEDADPRILRLVEDEDAPGGMRSERVEADPDTVRREILDGHHVRIEFSRSTSVTLERWVR